MATRKTIPEPEVIETVNNDVEKTLAEQQEEIRQLREELAKAQRKPGGGGLQDDAAMVRKAAQEAADAGIDAFEIVVSMRIPRRGNREDPWYWLNVNGRSCQLPANDQIQELRLPWAEDLINKLEAERRAENFQDSLEVYDPITNPKRD